MLNSLNVAVQQKEFYYLQNLIQLIQDLNKAKIWLMEQVQLFYSTKLEMLNTFMNKNQNSWLKKAVNNVSHAVKVQKFQLKLMLSISRESRQQIQTQCSFNQLIQQKLHRYVHMEKSVEPCSDMLLNSSQRNEHRVIYSKHINIELIILLKFHIFL